MDSLSYRPRAYYLRRALRRAKDVDEARLVGMTAIHQLEDLLAWAREQGLEPPKRVVTEAEARDNPRFSSTSPPF